MALAAAAVFGFAAPDSAAAAEKFKIYLSMSYIGNDWQAEAQRMISAMAASKDYRDKVDLRIQVAGPDARKQIQQINSMVQAGAQAIITFPISPTALNNVVKNACDKKVFVIAYDAEITEPCAYNIHIDQSEAGRVTGEWLVNELHGKGNIVVITGVPGTSVDKFRTAAAKEVFAKNPGIKIIAEVPGMWSQAVAREKLSEILATHSWNDIDGLWMQVGCYTAASMQIEAGIPTDKIKPCAGEAANGHRVQMLPPGAVEGVDNSYKPFGYHSISYGSPPYSGALALKKAVDLLEGKQVPKTIMLPLPLAKTGEMRLCEKGSWEEMKNGCNVFDPKLVPPGWFADIFGPETPEVGFGAALLGQPEE
ncbi:MAG TPA: sugar ABC transporter substrate-binding protein [Stellaceae bacterium]|nr:sugar ABC transporter substrate-binding protein [Stellaceae bacterium]